MTDNTADKISDTLARVADGVDTANQAGIQTGKAGLWLRIGSMLAGLFGKRK